MANLWFTTNAVLPIILTVLVGYILKKVKFFNEGFLKTANKLCFMVLIPILLFYNIYSIKSFDQINWWFILFISVVIILLFLIGLLAVTLFVKDPKQKGVILQCTFRSNYAIIGIPLATQLGGVGSQAAIVASLVAAFSIPLFNMFAVISLSIFSDDENAKIDYLDILKKIAKNPLILGVFSGLIVFGIRMILQSLNIGFTIKEDIPFLFETIKNLATISTPLALLVLGGQFTFEAIGKLKKQIIMGTVLRTLFVPTVCLISAFLFGFREIEFPALIALFGTPVAVSSVAMAQQMNADDELAGQLVVWTTISSAFTLFIIIMICKTIGII